MYFAYIDFMKTVPDDQNILSDLRLDIELDERVKKSYRNTWLSAPLWVAGFIGASHKENLAKFIEESSSITLPPVLLPLAVTTAGLAIATYNLVKAQMFINKSNAIRDNIGHEYSTAKLENNIN